MKQGEINELKRNVSRAYGQWEYTVIDTGQRRPGHGRNDADGSGIESTG
jgi:hypothetical protein